MNSKLEDEPTITISNGRLMWLMIFYHENLQWINNETIPQIKNPYNMDKQKEINKVVAFYITMIENNMESGLDNESPAYNQAQKWLSKLHQDSEPHYFDNIAHAHYM